LPLNNLIQDKGSWGAKARDPQKGQVHVKVQPLLGRFEVIACRKAENYSNDKETLLVEVSEK
jgi:hypothetical protein